jgi:hypothetical protein
MALIEIDGLDVGTKMPDSTVYAGISPDTGKPMYTTPEDAPDVIFANLGPHVSLTMAFKEAQEYAQTINACKEHGHDDWRLPTKAELNVLFNNRAAIGGFDLSGSDPSGCYWSSSHDLKWYAWEQRFTDGHQRRNYDDNHASVRLVRTDAPKVT